MPPYEIRKLGVYLTKPDTSAAYTTVEVSTCSVPVCQGWNFYAVVIHCSKPAQKHRIRILLVMNTRNASVTWCFEALSLIFKEFVSVRTFNASINSVPDGSKENNTSIVRVLDVSSLKLNALHFFETSGTDYSVTRRHVPEQRSPQPYRCDDAKTCRFL